MTYCEAYNKVMDHYRGGVFVDAGANMGGYTEQFSVAAGKGGTVIAIEPTPHMYDKLVERCTRICANHEAPTVLTYRVGLDSKPGHGKFKIHNAWTLLPTNKPTDIAVAHPSMEGAPPDGFEVEFVTLDSLATQIDFFKLDVDGYELRALEGGGEVLARCRPTTFVELSFMIDWISGPGGCGRVVDWFAEREYSFWSSVDNCKMTTEQIRNHPRCINSSFDVLCVPNEKLAMVEGS